MSILNMLPFRWRYTKGSILALDHYNWFGFDFANVKASLNHLGFDYHSIDILEARTWPEYKEADADFLYQAVIYTVCNELEIVETEVNLNNPYHLEVFDKWKRVAANCAGYVAQKIKEWRITKIFIPQGYVLEAAVCRLLAIRMNLPILAIENTLSSSRMLWENVSGITVNANLSKNYYWKYQSIISQRIADEFTHQYLANIKSYKVSEHATPHDCSLKTKEAKKVILFLGQVYVDSSVLFGIHRFASQEKIIEQLCEYCTQNGHTLVVKLHPKEISGNSMVNTPLNKMTWRKICGLDNFANQYHGNPDIIIDHENRFDTYKLIERADVCVTINSMSGLEARLGGKNVILCGNSCYGGLGFTADVYDNAELNFHLDKILHHTGGCDERMQNDALKFFYIYLNLYCVEKTETELLRLLASC